MAGSKYTSQSIPFADTKFNGGLNSTASPLNLKENESSDLQNIDFDRFGSLLKRNGYATLNTDAGTSIGGDGLYWYEYDNAGTAARFATRVYDSKLEKMDALDGTWDDISGGLTITSGNHTDFETFTNTLYATNGEDVPFKWAGAGTAVVMDVPANLTKAKYIELYENYMFLANVVVNSVSYPTRFYWSAIRDATSWNGADWIEVDKDNGQSITGLLALSDRLIVFKTHSIYNVFFTGDADIPFIVKKSNSSVGCQSFSSIQAVENGVVFFSLDGFYFFDGMNSTKISDRITSTILDYNTTNFTKIRSLVQKTKNKVWWTFTSSGQTTNDIIIYWDYFNNAWGVYTGIAASAMATFYVDGTNERPYFQDYTGRVYRADTGTNDYPANSVTAISAYYYTNWRSYKDLVNQKDTEHIYIYYEDNSAILSISYSFDLDSDDWKTITLDTSLGTATWDTDNWDEANWAVGGGGLKRLDLNGRGRLVRIKFENNILGETFKIDGLGSLAHLETQV